MLKFEYRGLDIMDQIASIPIAFDQEKNILHIKDTSYVVWPDFNGKSGYQLSDSFFKMVSQLKSQYLFKEYSHLSIQEWVDSFSFYFYKEPMILLFNGDKFLGKIPFNSMKSTDFLIYSEWAQ